MHIRERLRTLLRTHFGLSRRAGLGSMVTARTIVHWQFEIARDRLLASNWFRSTRTGAQRAHRDRKEAAQLGHTFVAKKFHMTAPQSWSQPKLAKPIARPDLPRQVNRHPPRPPPPRRCNSDNGSHPHTARGSVRDTARAIAKPAPLQRQRSRHKQLAHIPRPLPRWLGTKRSAVDTPIDWRSATGRGRESSYYYVILRPTPLQPELRSSRQPCNRRLPRRRCM